MNAVTRPCPYCNADAIITPGSRDGQRLPCPRCGETFVYRGPNILGEPPIIPRNIVAPPRRSNRSIAAVVLGVMTLAATLGIVYALATVGFRRNNDRPTKDTAEALAVVRRVDPRDLAGIRYLPGDVNLIAAIHVAEILGEPNGRKFLARFRPTELLPRNAGAEVANNLEKWTGLKLEDIDHIVIGMSVEGRLTPRVTLVAQSRRRCDPATVRAALKANSSPEPGGREVYRFKPDRPLEALWPEALVWFADERTVVVAVPPEDRKAALPEPAAGIEHLSRAMKKLLTERLESGTQAWVAGHADDWNKTGVKLLLLAAPVKERQALEKMRSFAAGVQFAPEPTVRAAFEGADEAAAERLEKYLVPPAGERKPLRLLGSQPEAADLGRELAESLKADRAGTWVTLQARARPETLRKALADRDD